MRPRKCITSTDVGVLRASWMRGSSPRMTLCMWRRAIQLDSTVKQPRAAARILVSAPGRPSFEFAIPRLPNEGSGAPAGAGACEAPGEGGTSTMAQAFLPSKEDAPPGAPLAAFCDWSGRAFERGPATPVSQLLAAGPNACERSPAIARALGLRLPRSPRRRIDRWRDFPGHRPGGSGHISAPSLAAAPSSRRPMTTPLEEQEGDYMHIV